MKKISLIIYLSSLLLCLSSSIAQNSYELNEGWKCMPSKKIKKKGEDISKTSYSIAKWKPAVVPGTVLTNMLANKEIPDPFYGLNNESIPDIYDVGRKYYTYWFAKDFDESAAEGEHVWLNFRGINYSCNVYLNGSQVNKEPFEGMFIRKSYDITSYLSKDGKNRLVVIVFPPNPVGKPNGGQGGDGTIAKNVAHQYVAGWDWIQPVRDRNTGIWDKIYIEKTRSVNLKNPHVVILVPGKRSVDGLQADAIIKVTSELENCDEKAISGVIRYKIEGETISQKITVPAKSTIEAILPDYTLKNPRLWWPNGYGKQDLYTVNIEFVQDGGTVSDHEKVTFGVREVHKEWNEHTRSAQILVNGQKIFIKGGNWIISDAMLRFSDKRYDAEIRFHRDMNLNLIRVWGGALTERPEFYKACDKYGLLVMQDFWMSGDCNGRWVDSKKRDDQPTRRNYPDDHNLFKNSVIDMVKMIRNYPSLAFWCGGNEITPPEDILVALRDTILPKYDGTRWFIEYSNSDSMSYNSIGGNGDGPYGIQDISTFWNVRTFPFNSEVGSVGIGDYVSLKRFIPEKNLIAPDFDISGNRHNFVDTVWAYHKYIGYDQFIDPYGKVKDVRDFAMKAQLVNYNQYRALMEGFSSHMWDWYTGSIIWKTQNPWTALRGQMYDYYLDVNAGLYGLRSACEPLHVMRSSDGMLYVVNNGFTGVNNVLISWKVYDIDGNEYDIGYNFISVNPSSIKPLLTVRKSIGKHADKGCFLSLRLTDDDNGAILSDNLYWFPDKNGEYSGLQQMSKASVFAKAQKLADGRIQVDMENKNKQIAFFSRIALIDSITKERILPAFYSDNYISVLSGETKSIIIEYNKEDIDNLPSVSIEGWNVPYQEISIE